MGLFHHVLVYMGDWRPTFGPSCTEFVYSGCWHFDNGATSKIDDVLAEHGGLFHVLPLAVRLNLFFDWFGLGWGWALGIWGIRVWGQGLTILFDNDKLK